MLLTSLRVPSLYFRHRGHLYPSHTFMVEDTFLIVTLSSVPLSSSSSKWCLGRSPGLQQSRKELKSFWGLVCYALRNRLLKIDTYAWIRVLNTFCNITKWHSFVNVLYLLDHLKKLTKIVLAIMWSLNIIQGVVFFFNKTRFVCLLSRDSISQGLSQTWSLLRKSAAGALWFAARTSPSTSLLSWATGQKKDPPM